MQDDQRATNLQAVYALPEHQRQVVQELHSRIEQVMLLPRVIYDEEQPFLIRQSCLDAFLLHIRAFATFLAPPSNGTRGDDRHAAHFAQGWRGNPELIGKLLNVGAQVSKQLAHVTTLRIGDGPDLPPTGLSVSKERATELTGDLAHLWDDFARHADFAIPILGLLKVWDRSDGTLITQAAFDRMREEK